MTSFMLTPPSGTDRSVTIDAVHTTRTEAGDRLFAVSVRVGTRSCVRYHGPMAFVAMLSSYPWAETEPIGGIDTPALLKRTSSLDSFDMNSSAAALIVGR